MQTTGLGKTLAVVIGAVLLTASIAIAANHEPPQTEPRAAQQNRIRETRVGGQPYSVTVRISLDWGRSDEIAGLERGAWRAPQLTGYAGRNGSPWQSPLTSAAPGWPAEFGDGYTLIITAMSGHSERPARALPWAAPSWTSPVPVTAGIPDVIWCMIHLCKRWG